MPILRNLKKINEKVVCEFDVLIWEKKGLSTLILENEKKIFCLVEENSYFHDNNEKLTLEKMMLEETLDQERLSNDNVRSGHVSHVLYENNFIQTISNGKYVYFV